MSNLKTLAEAAQTAPGAFISGGFQANVQNAKARQSKAGKSFWTCTLTEGGLEVSATSFSKDLTSLDGHLVKFSGMGLKRGDDYNGKAQISLGDKAIISPIGGTVTVTGSYPGVSVVNLPHVVAPTGTTGPSRIEGVTVGMAINKAVDICLKTGDTNEDTLWHWSSTLIRLSQKLQAGNLAPESGIEQPSDEQPY
jgi:hypothetical protein